MPSINIAYLAMVLQMYEIIFKKQITPPVYCRYRKRYPSLTERIKHFDSSISWVSKTIPIDFAARICGVEGIVEMLFFVVGFSYSANYY